MNIELYIADQLCDLEKSDLSIRLKRQFINPTQLNTKDAQKSYALTLPSTPTNDQIFRYANVEETSGKFSFYPNAKLYVNGILILDGKFRLTEIALNSYKGNLGVPAPLTAKDVFGERMMNNAGEWKIDFNTLDDFSSYNNGKHGDIPPAIFPLALYGLIPNEKKTDIDDNKIDRASITSNSRFELEDFPASVNCLQMLETIFKQANYTLTGTAMNNEFLKNLYVSYKNPNEYSPSYPPRKFRMQGQWINLDGGRAETQVKKLHYKDDNNENTNCTYAACNLFQSDNLKITNLKDPSKMATIGDDNKVELKIPYSGLYKINFKGDLFIWISHHQRQEYRDLNNEKIIALSFYYKDSTADLERNLANCAFELKIVRHRDVGHFNLEKAVIDNSFYQKNQNQSHTSPSDNDIFPLPHIVNFIDPLHNPHLVSGFSWGRVCTNNINHKTGDYNVNMKYINPRYYNENEKDDPKNAIKYTHANLIAIKHGKSWGDYDGEKAISAMKSNGYVNRGGTPVSGDNAYKVSYIDNSSVTIDYGRDEGNTAKGEINQLIWLEKGDKLSILDLTDMAQKEEWIQHYMTFDLEIEAFNPDREWLANKMNDNGSSNAQIDPIKSEEKYLTNEGLNLTEFLPSEIKIDEWLEDFCKAFNLELINKDTKSFELNLKNKVAGIGANTSKLIDLDKKSHVVQAVNESLNLPRIYELGFTIDKNEEGYAASIDEKQTRTGNSGGLNDGATGGGTFYTQSNEANVVKQNSKFSYCWYKELTDNTNNNEKVKVPIITEKEVWDIKNDYREMLKKTYHNKAQRFWFKDKKTINLKMGKEGSSADVALVKNIYDGDNKLWINYEDKPNSIMRNYFTLLTNQKNYTVVECYLSPEEYNDLDKSLIRFNGDLYTVAEADGYDPMGNSKTKLKLIKKG